jgi:hypothetical protein
VAHLEGGSLSFTVVETNYQRKMEIRAQQRKQDLLVHKLRDEASPCLLPRHTHC